MIRRRFVVAHAPAAVVAAETARRMRAPPNARVGAADDFGAASPDGQALIDQQRSDAIRSEVIIAAVLGAGASAGAWIGYTYPPPMLFPSLSLVSPKVAGLIAGGFVGLLLAAVGGFVLAISTSAEM